MKTMHLSKIAFLVLCTSWVGNSSTSLAAEPISKSTKELTIGSDAPALQIEHWVFNGEGKFKAVEKFEKGKVYVIEFWATTCGPCIQSIPHIVALQDKYADKGLQIIGVSSEPLDMVKEFLPTRAADIDGKPTTIGNLAKKYCLTTDPDGSTEVDYMLAAKQNSIPTAFIVGKDSKIEWFGHPMEMEDPLTAVIEDKWDRAKYKAEQDLFNEIQATMSKLTRAKKFKEAIVALDGFLKKVDEPQIKFVLYKSKIEMQIMAGSATSEVAKSFDDAFALCEGEPMFVQDLAWTSYEYFVEDKIDSKKIVRNASVAMEKALIDVKGPLRANMLDTLSHIQFVLGDLAGAIKSQEEAVKVADPADKEGFEEFLKELRSQVKK